MMLLQNKNAIIYGAGGSLGGAVARAFANAGANVFVTGHKFDSVKNLADEIKSAGDNAEAAEVDALNEKQVNDYIRDLVDKAGTIDISFNAISLRDTQGMPLTDMLLEDFVRPV